MKITFVIELLLGVVLYIALHLLWHLDPKIFIIIGLCLSIVGCIIIFFYGWPSPITSNGSQIVVSEANEKSRKGSQRTKYWAMTGGLACLILGFIGQLYGILFTF